MTIENILKNIIDLCTQFSADRVILFGSRAKGTNTDRSDIDIAVRGVKISGSFRKNWKKYRHYIKLIW